MKAVQFKAILKTPENQLIEHGFGKADPQSGTVDFWAPFVPLYPMGQKLRILRLLEGEEAQQFTGVVYLSASNLLRLVQVEDVVLPPLLQAPMEVDLPAFAQLSEPPKSWLPFGKGQHKAPKGEFPITLYTLCPKSIAFRCPHPLEEGVRLRITTLGEPFLQGVVVEITQVMAFGTQGSGYRANVRLLEGDTPQRLGRFMENMGTLFPRLETHSPLSGD